MGNQGNSKVIPNLSSVISERLLPRVRQPAQYIGLETNAYCKDVDSAQITVAMAFPDTYSVGISHQGNQILYHIANNLPGVACDRTYCPLPDAEAVMRSEKIPLFGWESRRAVGHFDMLAFSIPHETCLTNVLTMLDLAGVPLRTNQRTEMHPIIIAGDAIADAPEPMAPFIDLFCVGDGEETFVRIIELLRQAKQAGASRQEFILQAARSIPAVYAPQYYRPVYNDDGTLKQLCPVEEGLPHHIKRARIARLSNSPDLANRLVPLTEAVHDRIVIEIMRGCPHSCRFCQAGATRKPVRCRSVDEIIDIARRAVKATGYHEISLLSLSSSDYPRFKELVERLTNEFAHRNISISLPSLRVDKQLEIIPLMTSQVRKSGLTIAAEAGTERLRRAINKNITEREMLNGVRAAWKMGWRHVKVYFMAGLPGEKDEDIDAIFELCQRLSQTRMEVDSHRGNITAAVSWFVPRPHTPMQWAAMRQAEYFWSVRQRLKKLSRRTAIQFKFHRIERSILEGVLARGDRRLADVIETAWKQGARFDAWNEYFDYEKWQYAFEKTGVNPYFYAHRQRSTDELLPWDHIESGYPREKLLQEWERLIQAIGQ